MQVQEIMTANPACCTPDTDLQTVASLMVSNNCGAIPVVDDPNTKRLQGIVTDRDITCRTLARGKDPMSLTARDCMTWVPTTVTADATIEDCFRIMEDQHVRRIPVVDQNGCCGGIVALADIAKSAPVLDCAEVVREISMAA